MTKDQIQQMKFISYANWLTVEKFGGEPGIRDVKILKSVVSLPAGLSLTCFQGARLPNRRDLYNQLGWFVYYMIDSEPFNSNNRLTVLLLLIWCLRYYHLDFYVEELVEYIKTLDTLKHGNSDISVWFSSHCH